MRSAEQCEGQSSGVCRAVLIGGELSAQGRAGQGALEGKAHGNWCSGQGRALLRVGWCPWQANAGGGGAGQSGAEAGLCARQCSAHGRVVFRAEQCAGQCSALCRAMCVAGQYAEQSSAQRRAVRGSRMLQGQGRARQGSVFLRALLCAKQASAQRRTVR